VIQGVDLSHWNEITDLDRLVKDCDFVYNKCSQGLSVDPRFKERHQAMKGRTYRGIFHFLDYAQAHYPKGKDLEWGARQAEFVFDLVKDDMPELPIWNDVENNEGDLTWERITSGLFGNIGRVLKVKMGFKLRWKELTGLTEGTYTRLEFARHMQNFTDGILAMARYPYAFMNRSGFVTDFQGLTPGLGAWSDWTFWQYSSSCRGEFLGLKGKVDCDVFNGDETDWSAFVGKSLPKTLPPVEDEPGPLPISVEKCGVVVSAVNVRHGIGTSSPQLYINGRPWVLPKGEQVPVYETKYDTAGNPWLRIGYQEWIAAEFGGMKLAGIA